MIDNERDDRHEPKKELGQVPIVYGTFKGIILASLVGTFEVAGDEPLKVAHQVIKRIRTDLVH